MVTVVPEKRLRAVSPGETPPSQRKLSITQAAEEGNSRELLVAMRSRLAKAVEDPNCPPRDLAALTRRLQDVNREIEALDVKLELEASESVDVADEAWDSAAL